MKVLFFITICTVNIISVIGFVEAIKDEESILYKAVVIGVYLVSIYAFISYGRGTAVWQKKTLTGLFIMI